MTRSERKRYFEQLMTLRDTYRAERHESTGMTIDQAVTFAARAFNDAEAADAADAAAIERSLTKGGATAD